MGIPWGATPAWEGGMSRAEQWSVPEAWVGNRSNMPVARLEDGGSEFGTGITLSNF